MSFCFCFLQILFADFLLCFFIIDANVAPTKSVLDKSKIISIFHKQDEVPCTYTSMHGHYLLFMHLYLHLRFWSKGLKTNLRICLPRLERRRKNCRIITRGYKWAWKPAGLWKSALPRPIRFLFRKENIYLWPADILLYSESGFLKPQSDKAPTPKIFPWKDIPTNFHPAGLVFCLFACVCLYVWEGGVLGGVFF